MNIHPKETVVARTLRPLFPLFLVATLAVVYAGCTPSSPEEQIAKIRSEYEVELSSWKVVTPPAAEGAGEAEMAEGEEAMAEGEQAMAEGEEPMAEGEEGMGEEAMAEPEGVSIQFDLVVYLRGRDTLKGLTVDLTQADASQQEKAVYHQWVDTSNVLKGSPGQVTFVLEGVVMGEGDVFAASIAPGVPADLSAYREFSEPAP